MFSKAATLLALVAFVATTDAAAVQTTTRVAQGIQFLANTNVDIKNREADYSRRAANVLTIPSGSINPVNVALFSAGSSSAAANLTLSNQVNANIKVDYLNGVLLALNPTTVPGTTFNAPGVPPTLFFGYYTASASFSSLLDFSISGSGAAALSIFWGLTERTPTEEGTYIYTDFNTLIWRLSSVTNSAPAADGSRLKYVTLTHTGTNNYKISITFVMSETLAVMNVGGATVNPKAIETIIEIDNYPYRSTGNRLELLFYSITGALSGEAQVSTTKYDDAFIAGDGPAAPYVSCASTALVDGSNVAVTVGTLMYPDVDYVLGLIGDLRNKINNNVQLKASLMAGEFRIRFPPNAAAITYDPSTGFEKPNSAAHAAPLFAAVVALLAAFLNAQ